MPLLTNSMRYHKETTEIAKNAMPIIKFGRFSLKITADNDSGGLYFKVIDPVPL